MRNIKGDSPLPVSAIRELTMCIDTLGSLAAVQEKEVVPRIKRLAGVVGVSADEDGALDLLDVLDAAVAKLYRCEEAWNMLRNSGAI